MPAWAVDVIVGVVVTTGGGIIALLLKIQLALGTITANQAADRRDIEDLKTWRLNSEHARALTQIYAPARRSHRDIP